jgi:hypothetical protein
VKAEAFLSRCEKVKSTGNGTWLACCPAHDDKHPSMTVRELEDGRVLLHCFTGCGVEEILGAVGMEFDALFPDKPQEQAKPLRRPFPVSDVLAAIAGEVLVAWVISRDMEIGKVILQDEFDRLSLANRRIQEAMRLVNG